MNKKNIPGEAQTRYVSVMAGERDSGFLHNNGVNSWPLVKKSLEQIAEELNNFRLYGVVNSTSKNA